MRSQKINKFIKSQEHLFWYTPIKEKKNLSDTLLLETILNYADLRTIKEFFDLMGLKKINTIFQNLKGRQKQNLYPEIHHLFSEYLKRNA
jgi:hypothetical protein